MVKKLFSAALAAVAVFGALTSCGEKAAGPFKLTVNAQLPEGVAQKVSSVKLSSNEAILGGAQEYTVALAQAEAQVDGDKLSFSAVFPEAPASIAENTGLVAQFYATDAPQDVYTAYVDLPAGPMSASVDIDARYCTYSAGAQDNGTAEHPYLLGDKYQMLAMYDELHEDETKYFRMVADIDLTEINWRSLNNQEPYSRKMVFDGAGHTISNLTSTWELSTGDVDLYAYPSFAGILAGEVKNVTFDGATITTLGRAGGVVAGYLGHMDSNVKADCANVVIKNSSVDAANKYAGIFAGTANNLGSLTGCAIIKSSVKSTTARVGGFIGSLGRFEKIEDCYAEEVEVTGGSYYVGGMVGEMQYAGPIKNCHTSGKVIQTTTSYSRSGGLIGRAQGTIEDSWSSCEVGGPTELGVGGQFNGGFIGDIVEGKTVSIKNCYASGNITSSNFFSGGFIGLVEKNSVVTIEKCYATGAVNTASKSKAAGFISSVDSGVSLTISNCYASGAVDGGKPCGGFIGGTNATTTSLNVTNCYTSSAVQGNGNGALVGENLMASSAVTCSGFIGWWPSGDLTGSGNAITAPISYVGNAGTISAKASEFAWDANIWDLSGAVPVLK